MKNALAVLSLALLAACQSDQQASNQSTTASAQIVVPQLVCKVVRDPDTHPDTPLSEVYLQVGETAHKVADVSVCLSISKDEYDQYQIPPRAISAVGGWYAGAGDYFYVIEEEDGFRVMHAAVDEMAEGSLFPYEKVLFVDAAGKVFERK